MTQPGPMRISPGTFVGITGKQTLFSLIKFQSQRDMGSGIWDPFLLLHRRTCLSNETIIVANRSKSQRKKTDSCFEHLDPAIPEATAPVDFSILSDFPFYLNQFEVGF